jgi:BlaI family penicillinase repressor
MTKRKYFPTDGELEILQILWGKGPSTVKNVNIILANEKEVGYTTTLKIMQIMHEKKLVSREKDGKSHIYTASISIDDTRQQVLDKVVDTVFQGSAMKLVMQALGNRKSSKEELEEIKKYLDTLNIVQGEEANDE